MIRFLFELLGVSCLFGHKFGVYTQLNREWLVCFSCGKEKWLKE